MDDWYVTKALMNSTNALYTDIGQHFVSTNNEAELMSFLKQNASNRMAPIFGHFRPSKKCVLFFIIIHCFQKSLS